MIENSGGTVGRALLRAAIPAGRGGPGRSPRPGDPGASRGFSLVEVVIVLAIVAALVGAAVPLGFQMIESNREDSTRRQLLGLKTSIIGEPQGGRDENEPQFGFNGDLGALPDSVPQLLKRHGLPTFRIDSVHRIGVGWRGPYTSLGGIEDTVRVDVDHYNRPLTYEPGDTVVGGETWAAFLRSNGPDRAPNTADDITVPILENEVRGITKGFVLHGSGKPLKDATVTYVFRRGGALVDTVLTTDSLGMWVMGQEHAYGPVRVFLGDSGSGGSSSGSLALVDGSGKAFCDMGGIGGGENGDRDPDDPGCNTPDDVEFTTVNTGSEDVVLTAMTASWVKVSGSWQSTPCYRDLQINEVDVKDPPDSGVDPVCSGETFSFVEDDTDDTAGDCDPNDGNNDDDCDDVFRVSSAATALTSAGSPTSHRFVIDRPENLAPDIVLGGISVTGGGEGEGQARIEILDFRHLSGSGGPKADMQGVRFDIVLHHSDGSSSSITFTTPTS